MARSSPSRDLSSDITAYIPQRPDMSSAVAAPASTQADRDGRSRLGTLSGLSTIRARLYIALGFMAATTVVCSLIALYAFTNIGGTTTKIVSQSMPATVHSLRL